MPAIDLKLTLDRDPSAARMARGALLPLRDRLGEEHFTDLRVVVSELVVNATLHGSGDDIRLFLTLEDNGVVRGRIEDGGNPDWIEPKPETGAVDEGLGLLIVDSLTSTWGVAAAPPSVWFEIDPPISAVALTPKRQIHDELVSLHARINGRVARSADVLFADDAVVAFLEGVSAELGATPEDATSEASFRASIERILGRRVISLATFTAADEDGSARYFG